MTTNRLDTRRTVSCTTTDIAELDGDRFMPDASYTAELIRNARRSLDQADDMSNYERRLALREMKLVINDALRDLHTEPSSATVKKYLALGEGTAEDVDQVKVLDAEMQALLKRSEMLTREVAALCAKIGALWQKHGYVAQGIFEVRIAGGGKGINASGSALVCLQMMHDTWAAFDVTKSGESQAMLVQRELERLRSIYGACCVPDALTQQLLEHKRSRCLPALQTSTERAGSCLPGYEDLTKLINARVPALPSAVIVAMKRTAATEESAVMREFDQVEEFVECCETVIHRIDDWELLSDVPFFISRGALLRFDKSGEVVSDLSLPFSEILKRSIKTCKLLTAPPK